MNATTAVPCLRALSASALCLWIMACNSSHKHNNSDAGIDVIEEPPPIPGKCAGLRHQSPLEPVPDFDSLDCKQAEPTLSCNTAGTKVRTYDACALVDPNAANDCLSAQGPCDCGELGDACASRPLTDERPCILPTPTDPFPLSAWGSCSPQPSTNACAGQGTREREVLLCSIADLTESINCPENALPSFFEGVGQAVLCQQQEACDRVVDGLVIDVDVEDCTFSDMCTTAGIGGTELFCMDGSEQTRALECTRPPRDGALFAPTVPCERACEPLFDPCCDLREACPDDQASCAPGCQQQNQIIVQSNTCAGEEVIEANCDLVLDPEECQSLATCTLESCSLPVVEDLDGIITVDTFQQSAQFGTDTSALSLTIAPTLDAAQTTLLCRGQTIFGDLTLDLSHPDADTTATLNVAHLERVTGTLTITSQGPGRVHLTLASLAHVGQLDINHAGALEIETLTPLTVSIDDQHQDITISNTSPSVAGQMVLSGQAIEAQNLTLTSVENGESSYNINNEMTLSGHLTVTRATSVNTQIESIAKDLRVSGVGTALSMGVLQSVAGSVILDGVNLDALVLSALEEVGALAAAVGTPNETCSPSCIGLETDLCPELDGLQTDDSDSDFFGDACENDPMDPEPMLRGDLRISNSTGARFEVPALRLIQSDLRIAGNADLISFDFPSLRTIGGRFDMRQNNKQRTFTLAAVESIGGGFWVTAPFTKTCDLLKYVAVVQSRGRVGTCVSACGNPDDLGTGSRDDTDGDFIVDGCDNCPEVPNADQTDSNNNGIGDDCDPNP